MPGLLLQTALLTPAMKGHKGTCGPEQCNYRINKQQQLLPKLTQLVVWSIATVAVSVTYTLCVACPAVFIWQ